ncbi:TetR/AcrR family transcriptional regulator [Actinokineospora globicatena]|uniref:TetR/AcrR family transcriptional regulator n=1 Tax=Actinokineospora globicatena TaxID=103729 RepID=UPI0020A57FCE|nr:TetR/AcrR family transcriptional regulator C-terminal domain-containing protein [Actinokineospora globicatena]MCP2302002.1 transcriptional regulator, TetR family [Actinokineospora globicatena]GLW76336.1 TetR family transcriptional regulator [Actinokineospora globicatena]GLW83172.1 TetR family transcriptional regulator [Actinokineospora globicatena]
MTDTGLPASIAAAWGVLPPSRGPKRALSLDRIVTAAVAVADADGLDALSMSRVAGELGTSAMSLYRYVSAKDELLTLMTDAIFVDAAAVTSPDWRPALTELAWGCLRAYRAHPWAVRIPISGPPVTPHQLRWLETGLAALAPTPLTAAEKMSALLLLSGIARNDATLAHDLGNPGDLMPTYAQTLRQILPPQDFPHLLGILNTDVMTQDDHPDVEFTWSLARILDGLAALIEAKSGQ